MPDNELPIESAKVAGVRDLAAGWTDGKRPGGEADDWSPTEWQLFLQDLPRQLSEDDCRWLDETFKLSGQGNYEVLVEWLTVAAASNFAPALPRVREVLTDVGRMKYLKPLYTALMKGDATAKFAREVYDDVKESYHPLSRGSVSGILAG